MTNQHLIVAAERAIVAESVKGLLAAGYELKVYDGEEVTLKRTTDAATINAAMFDTGTSEAMLLVYKPGEKKRCGWVHFIYGNTGWDVTHDHTTNLTDALASADKLADEWEAKIHA